MLILMCTAFCSIAQAHTSEHETTIASSHTIETLVDQHGNAFSMELLEGKTVLLNFIFTQCPGPCPVQTVQLQSLQDQLSTTEKSSIQLLSISVDPNNDTPERLVEFARKRQVSFDNWSFVTGPAEKVDELIASFGAEVSRAADSTLEHSLTLYLVGVDGELWQSYSSLVIDRMLLDMRTANRLGANL